jgi:hypothetical protein
VWPPSKPDFVAFVASAAIGLAIWWPTMAMQPRYDYTRPERQGSPWYVPLMLGAAVVLALVYWKRWWVVAPGMVSLQLLVSPFTTPRGDNDGLWVLIIPIVVVLGGVLLLLCWGTASLARVSRRHPHA